MHFVKYKHFRPDKYLERCSLPDVMRQRLQLRARRIMQPRRAPRLGGEPIERGPELVPLAIVVPHDELRPLEGAEQAEDGGLVQTEVTGDLGEPGLDPRLADGAQHIERSLYRAGPEADAIAHVRGTLFHVGAYHRPPDRRGQESPTLFSPAMRLAVSRFVGRTLSVALTTLVIATSVTQAGAQPARSPAPRGTLFIVGGGPQPPALVQEFVRLAGGAGHAKIIVFAMASADGKASGEEKAEDLRKLGATALNVWATHDEANTDSVAHLLDGATGIWFGGGDQVLLTKALRGTKTEAAIHARYRAGAVVGGTSAGAAVMSAAMITGDERHPGGVRPVKDSASYMTIARDNMIMADGFGLLTNAVVDQHFLRRRRSNRLVSVVLEQPTHLGVGIDESTALIVRPDGKWRVMGESAAIVYDARRARITPTGTTLGATGVVMSVLPDGSTFDPKTGVATLP